MKYREYNSAREALGWTHEKVALVLGVSRRMPYRYQRGELDVPEPTSRLIRLLVLLRLTLSARKFEDIVKQLSR